MTSVSSRRSRASRTSLASHHTNEEHNESVQEIAGTYHRSKNTKRNYDGDVSRGKAFIAGLGDTDLKHAFEELSQFTPTALRVFIARKCEDEGCTYKTAEGIRSAFKRYFIDRFACDSNIKAYRCENGKWIGNPIYDQSFVDYMESLRKKYGRDGGGGGGGNQSLPMLYSDLAILMPHLQDPTTKKDNGIGLCLFMQAFLACGFSLFTRTDELLGLKGRDLDLGLRTVTGTPYFTIKLAFRKTNTVDPKKANVYEIHPQAHEPHACAHTKLLAWLDWLGNNARPLQADDLVFPAFATDGRVKLLQNMQHTNLQKVLDKFIHSSGLGARRKGRFTMHCLSRGGAQHRFMFAKEKWTFKALKWWGGWTEGEQVSKIMRYLLDEYVRYEDDYGDMLSPCRDDSRHSIFMGSSDSDPVTKQSIMLLQDSLRKEADERSSVLRQEIRQEISNLGLNLSQKIEDVLHAVASSSRHVPQAPSHASIQVGLKALPHASPQEHPQAPLPAAAQVQPPATVVHPVHPPRRELAEPSTRKRGRTARPLPQEGDPRAVADRIPDITHWKEAINQWYQGDHCRGLKLPLVVWGPAMRKTDPARYSQRKQIAMEYELLNKSDDRMKDVHGAALDKVFTTLKSIRKHKRLRRSGRPMQAQEVSEGDQGEDKDEDEDDDEDEDENEDRDGKDDYHQVDKEAEDEEEEPPLVRKQRTI